MLGKRQYEHIFKEKKLKRKRKVTLKDGKNLPRKLLIPSLKRTQMR